MFEQEIQQLSGELAASQQVVLNTASSVLGRNVNEASLHAIIGGKNRTHAHVWNRTFSCFEEFFSVWLDAMYKDYLSRKDDVEPMERAGFRNAMLLRESAIMEYAEKFLRRNFLRYFDERTQGKVASQNDIDTWKKRVESQKQNFQMIK